MDNRATRLTLATIFINFILFVLKLAAGIVSNHIATISDALNSLLDVFSSTATYYCVRVSRQEADEGHPFGHHRAEPIAGLVIAILTGILAFEMAKTASVRLFNPHTHRYPLLPSAALALSMVVKHLLSRHLHSLGKALHSPAMLASATDCRNDVIISSVALISVLGTMFWSVYFDDIATLFLCGWLLYSGFQIGIENLDYLMGKAAPNDLVSEIRQRAQMVDGVSGLNDVRSHYVGIYVHVEIHVEIDGALSTQISHDIGKAVQRSVESLPAVDKAFIHIDPV